MERRQHLKTFESIHFCLYANLFLEKAALPICLFYFTVQVAQSLRPSNVESFGKPSAVAKALSELPQPFQTRSGGTFELPSLASSTATLR